MGMAAAAPRKLLLVGHLIRTSPFEPVFPSILLAGAAGQAFSKIRACNAFSIEAHCCTLACTASFRVWRRAKFAAWKNALLTNRHSMIHTMTRREALKTAAGPFLILPAGLARGYAANEKLNVGVIGLAGMGRADAEAL